MREEVRVGVTGLRCLWLARDVFMRRSRAGRCSAIAFALGLLIIPFALETKGQRLPD